MLRDLWRAVRRLFREPTITATACLLLGLGVGVTVTAFSAVDAALFRPLPFRDAEQLVYLYRLAQRPDGKRVPVVLDGRRATFARARGDVFEAVAGYSSPTPAALMTARGSTPMEVGCLSTGALALLGVTPERGRGFGPTDVRDNNAILVSDTFWRTTLGGDTTVLGRHITVGDRSYVVIGVLPASVRYIFGSQVDAWTAVADDATRETLARLRSATDPTAANQALSKRPEGAAHPAPLVTAVSIGATRFTPQSRMAVFGALGAVALIFIVACANVANLLVMRAISRRGDMAVAQALGASRGALVRPFIVEGVLFGLLGGAVGLPVSWIGIVMLKRTMPIALERSLFAATVPQLDWRVAAFASAIALLAGAFCGVVPALRAFRWAGGNGLLSSGGRATRTRNEMTLIRGFVSCQIAATVVLLTTAALLCASVIHMISMPPGFEPSGLWYASLGDPSRYWPTQSGRLNIADTIAADLERFPGVKGVALGSPPTEGATNAEDLYTVGSPQRSMDARLNVFFVSHRYFDVAGIRLLQGRRFGPGDDDGAPLVVIISDNIAATLWPDGSAIGQQLRQGPTGRPYTVVGVVPHLKTTRFTNSSEMFFSARQSNFPLSFIVRVDEEATTLGNAVRSEIARIDPRLSIARFEPAQALYLAADPLAPGKFYTFVVGVVAVLGLTTAIVGLYALLSYTISRRTREVGIRLALGASSRHIRALAYREALWPVMIGLPVGLLVTAWVSGSAQALLFGVEGTEPLICGGVTAIVLVACGMAATQASRGALRIGPTVTLTPE